jgi:hypothetical protein
MARAMADGTAIIPIRLPADPVLSGVPLVMQGLALTTSGVSASNGLELVLCR